MRQGFLRKIVSLAWSLPGDIHFWWTVGIPAILAWVPALVAGGIAFLGNAPWWLVLLVGAGGYLLAFVASIFLMVRLPSLQRPIRSKELRQDCCELSKELFEFLNARKQQHPHKRLEWPGINVPQTPENQERFNQQFQESTRYNQQTKEQYDERFDLRVVRLLNALERHGWCTAEKRKKLDSFWQTPEGRMRRIAQYLDDCCHNLR